MASVLHGSARTTPCLRAEFQASKESTRSLAARYGLNPKTVAKWRKRTTTADAPMGPKAPKSTVLTPAEEAIVVAFRQKTLLPLDDVLGCLKDTVPNLSRSALHRCLQRHGISRLPVEETAEKRKRFKTYEIGYVHIDSCELRHADGKLVMFLAIDRVSKFTYVEFHDSAGKMEGSAFLRTVVEVFPYKIHTVLTDNGMAFADPTRSGSAGVTGRWGFAGSTMANVEKIRIFYNIGILREVSMGDMVKVSSAEFQKHIGLYQDMALVQPVTITRNGRDRTVMISADEYQRLKRRDREVLALDDFTEADLVAIRAAEPPAETALFDHELK